MRSIASVIRGNPISSCLRLLVSSPVTSKFPNTSTSTTTTAAAAFVNSRYSPIPIATTYRPILAIRNCATDADIGTGTGTGSDANTIMTTVSLDLSKLSTSIIECESQRQKSFDVASQLKVALARARHASLQHYAYPTSTSTTTTTAAAQTPLPSNDENLTSLVKQAMQIDRTRRPPSLSYAIQDYIRLQAYRHFLSLSQQMSQPESSNNDAETDTTTTDTNDTNPPNDADGFRLLLPPSSNLFQFPNGENNKTPSYDYDEDYLMGIMGLTQDLSRFAIAAGTTRDVHAVTHARNLVRDVLEYLMRFDFRNGMLRRKYDGVKYALKTCETVLYELSVTGCRAGGDDAADTGGAARKRFKKNPEEKDAVASSSSNGNGNSNGDTDVPPTSTEGIQEELETLRKRIEHRDDLRETLIKRCRDAQKKAKQAIYALHRGDYKRADKLLEECESITKKDLIPIVEEERSLRLGSSLGGVLEEYAEGMLFRAWILGMGEVKSSVDGEDQTLPQCTLLQPHHLTDKLPLSTEEYLGGLCDLSGEVGRYAVQRGTVRDSIGVRLCLNTNRAILHALETLERLPAIGGIGKKMDPLRFSVEKLERMCYELSLVEATGRSIVVDSVNDIQERGEGDQ